MQRVYYIAAFCVIALLFAMVPTAWLDSSHSICIIKNLFGVDCFGCGMTRAISCIFHGELGNALRYNKLVLIVLPLLIYLAIKWIRGTVQK